MIDPLLSYQTPTRPLNSGLLKGTSTYLLFLGCIYGLGGTCTGSLTVLAFINEPMAFGFRHAFRDNLVPIATLSLFLGTAISYIWSALRIRRASRAATIAALITSLLNAVIALIVAGGVVITWLDAPRRDIADLIPAIAFCLVMVSANAAASFLVIAVLRQLRRYTDYVSVRQQDV